MNSFDEKINAVKEELRTMLIQYETIQIITKENQIEQDKIVEQNLTLKNQIEELKKTQEDLRTKENDLNEREKQIIIKEKSIIASNRLLDEKLSDFRTKTLELTRDQAKYQKDSEELKALKKVVDQQSMINQKMEETELLRKKKITLKENQLDKELERLKNLQM